MVRHPNFGRRKKDDQPYPKTDLNLQIAISAVVPDTARVVKAFYTQIFKAETLERLRSLSILVVNSNLPFKDKQPLLDAIDKRYGELQEQLLGPRGFVIPRPLRGKK